MLVSIARPVSHDTLNGMRYTRFSYTLRKKIVDCFIEDLTATQTAHLLGINRKTANTWYTHLRELVAAAAGQIGVVKNASAFVGYHKRRVRNKNGLFEHVRGLHRAESKSRFILKKGFAAYVRKLSEGLLSI